MSPSATEEADPPAAGGHDGRAVDEDGPHIGWGRAIMSGLAIIVVGFLAAVYGTNLILTKLTGMNRSARQYLAATLFLAVIGAEAWVLRRLQARRLI